MLARYKKKLFLAGWAVFGIVLMTLAGIWLSNRIQPTVTAAPTTAPKAQATATPP